MGKFHNKVFLSMIQNPESIWDEVDIYKYTKMYGNILGNKYYKQKQRMTKKILSTYTGDKE